MIAGLFLYAARELAALYRFLGSPADAARLDGTTPTCSGRSRSRPGTAPGTRARSTPRADRSARRPATRGRSSSRARPGASSAARARTTAGRRRRFEAVEKYLYRPGLGCALQWPPYSTYHLELGEVSSYPPGFKENAGVFSHNNTWIHIGWALLGDGERALDYYLSICPSAKKDHDVYRSEPYVYAQMTASQFSPDARRGQELLADRHRRVVVRRRQPVHPRRPARVRRPAGRPLRAHGLEGLHRPAPIPRRRPTRSRSGTPGAGPRASRRSSSTAAGSRAT